MDRPHLRYASAPARRALQERGRRQCWPAAAIRQVNALDPLPDLVLLTGDVTDEGLPGEYAAARAILAGLLPPLLAIPGNHDERDAFRAAFPDHGHLPPHGPLHFAVGNAGPVRVMALDVTLPGLHHGEVDEAAATWLQHMLEAEPDRPTIVMMHQPPLECGVPYLDIYRCLGGDRLAAVIARFPAVERLLCGHVHRHMQMRFGGTLLCTAPSTATAIALQPRPDAHPTSFIEPPGFLLHHCRRTWRAHAQHSGGPLRRTVPVRLTAPHAGTAWPQDGLTNILWTNILSSCPNPRTAKKSSPRACASSMSAAMPAPACATSCRPRASPQGSFTNHFTSKEAFGLEILDLYFAGSHRTIEATLHNDALPPLERLGAWIDTNKNRLNQDSMRNGCLLGNFTAEACDHSESIRQRLIEIFAEIRGAVSYCLQAAVAQGEIPPTTDCDTVAGLRRLVHAGVPICWPRAERSPAPVERFKQVLFTLVLR